MLDKIKEMIKGKKDPKEKDRLTLLMEEKKAATKKKQAWVAVLNTHVNEKDIKNGFFELDWNNEFIEQLLDAGYSGESNEQIVDGWFKDVARNILKEQGFDPTRGAGYINVGPANKDGKSELS